MKLKRVLGFESDLATDVSLEAHETHSFLCFLYYLLRFFNQVPRLSVFTSKCWDDSDQVGSDPINLPLSALFTSITEWLWWRGFICISHRAREHPSGTNYLPTQPLSRSLIFLVSLSILSWSLYFDLYPAILWLEYVAADTCSDWHMFWSGSVLILGLE